MAEAPPSDVRTNFVDWAPILAGAVAASAISFVLFTAGAAIGLSLLSPYPSQSYGKWAATLSAFWAIFVPIFSLLLGGYLAGRMRGAWSTNPDEIQFRDGVHGLLVWSTALFIGVVLAFFTAGTAAQIGGELGKAAISDRGALVASSVDALVRQTPGALPPNQPSGPVQPLNETELTRILIASTANGSIEADDRAYLAQIVATRTGLPPEAAEKRVDEVFAKALEAIETARKTAIAAGLATATALLLGLAAAWYAAQRGGHHRDHSIPARFSIVVLRKGA